MSIQTTLIQPLDSTLGLHQSVHFGLNVGLPEGD